jgi:hypothetical protein
MAETSTPDPVEPEQEWRVPSAEAVRYGRKALQNQVDRLLVFEDQARAKGDDAAVDRWRRVRNLIERDLLGVGGGCVITPFDYRWLDPEFRRVMNQVRHRIDVEARTGE